MIKAISELAPSTIAALAALLTRARWEETDTVERRYAVWFGVVSELQTVEELCALFPRMHQAFFLKIPPGGYVHKHRDTDDVYTSFHVPVTTNAACESVEHCGDVPISHRMEVGFVYSFDRIREHSSANRGATERTHLILEIPK